MPKRILVVEDDDNFRMIVVEALEKNGYEPMGAASGEEAVQLSIQQPPDLIVLDLRLPGMDGWQTLKLVQEITRERNIPVLVATAFGDVPNRIQAYFNDTADYLVKPFALRELLSRIRRALEPTPAI